MSLTIFKGEQQGGAAGAARAVPLTARGAGGALESLKESGRAVALVLSVVKGLIALKVRRAESPRRLLTASCVRRALTPRWTCTTRRAWT